jgi:hypothetical protein
MTDALDVASGFELRPTSLAKTGREGRRSNPDLVWKSIGECHARRYGDHSHQMDEGAESEPAPSSVLGTVVLILDPHRVLQHVLDVLVIDAVFTRQGSYFHTGNCSARPREPVLPAPASTLSWS